MRVEPKVLVRRLNPASTRMLEAAVGAAATGQFYEITCEHLLLKLLEADDGDAAIILQHYGQRRPILIQRVQRSLERMRTGNGGRPVFSETLFQWIEDAWVIASLHYGATSLRSGHLLLQFIDLGSRYSGESFAELDAISVAELRKQFEEITARSPETPPGTGSQARRRRRRRPRGRRRRLGARPLHDLLHRRRPRRQDRPDLRPPRRDPPARRHPRPPSQKQPDHRRRARRRQERARRGPRPRHRHGDVPDTLQDVDLRGLDLGLLQAGASVKGEFEKRLKAVIAEVKARPHRSCSSSTRPTRSSAPAAGRATTPPTCSSRRSRAASCAPSPPPPGPNTKNTSRRTPPSSAASSRSRSTSPPRRTPPSCSAASARSTSSAHGVTIRDEAVVAAVSLSHRYIAGRQLPDKAIDLLDTAAATVKIEQRTRPSELVALDEELAALERAREAQLRDLADGATIDPIATPSCSPASRPRRPSTPPSRPAGSRARRRRRPHSPPGRPCSAAPDRPRQPHRGPPRRPRPRPRAAAATPR
jgi:type VI secretion system protein VasG